MAKKTGTERFDQTLAALPDEKAAGFKLGGDAKKAIERWLPANAGNKEMLGKELSLGGIHFNMSENERFMRHLKRGVMLAFLTVGGQTKAGLSNLKTIMKSETKEQLRTRLKNYLPANAVVVANKIHIAEGGFGKFEFSQTSWKHATSSNEHDAADAFSKAAVLINKAVAQGLSRLGDPVQKARFERWFGPTANVANVNTVKANMKKMHDAVVARTVKLYFRGNTAVNGKPTDLPINEPWNPGKPGEMKSGGYFGAAWPVQPGAFDQTKTHMLLGSAFFTALTHGTDCTAGVILHELSHSEAQTKDQPDPRDGKACYGHARCLWLATNRPALAVMNADNHEFYCEEFWQGTFKSKPNAGVNPIPDDDKRHVELIL